MHFFNVSSPLSGHEFIRTTCPEKALEKMASLGAKFVRPVHRGEFCFKVDALTSNDVTLAHGYHGYGTITSYDTSRYYWQALAVSGACKQESGKVETLLDSNSWSALHMPGEILTSQAGSNYQQLTVKISTTAVSRVLSSLLGYDVDDLTINNSMPYVSPGLQSMRRTAFSLASELNHIASRCSAAVLIELEQSLILSFLVGHQHNYSSALKLEPKAPSAGQLGLAEEYIFANWDKPLDISTLAKVCGVSARTILRYFNERRGCSPAEFIKKTRLQQAHERLRKGDEKTSVVATALQVGFSSLGHFARNYRAEFGENPSETLTRARGSYKDDRDRQAAVNLADPLKQ